MVFLSKKDMIWLGVIVFWIVVISYFHLNTPPTENRIHLFLMQSYFIPILLGAFQFGIKGGLGSAVVVSMIFTPHIMLQWTGGGQYNLLGFLQIAMFNIIGYLTGLKAQKEKNEKQRYQQATRELEESVKKLEQQSNELAELEEQLRQSDRLAVVGELTASLAHELRNPLGTIRGTVEILKEELPASAKQTEFFGMLIKETERMNTVVENYLNFAGKAKISPSVYDARETVHDTCLILASRSRKAGVVIEEHLPEFPVLLKGDPNDLRQILINILLNAVEATSSPGKITLTGRLADPEEDVNKSLETEPGHHRPLFLLSIKDQGIGMEAGELKNIFKPFYTTKKQGTGLGLSIVKRIADYHHWTIAVNSEPQQGTEFILTISLES